MADNDRPQAKRCLFNSSVWAGQSIAVILWGDVVVVVVIFSVFTLCSIIFPALCGLFLCSPVSVENPSAVQSVLGLPRSTEMRDLLFEATKMTSVQQMSVELFHLCVLFSTIDAELMSKIVVSASTLLVAPPSGSDEGGDGIALQSTLSMDAVRRELDVLAQFAGANDDAPIISIGLEVELEFRPGVYAPPWREIYGEMCYIQAKTHDVGVMMITGTNSGYFVNGGYQVTRPESSDGPANPPAINGARAPRMDYNARSPTYPTLLDLLRAQSAHFNRSIDNQEERMTERLAAGMLPGSPQQRGAGIGNVARSLMYGYSGDQADKSASASGPGGAREVRGSGTAGAVGAAAPSRRIGGPASLGASGTQAQQSATGSNEQVSKKWLAMTEAMEQQQENDRFTKEQRRQQYAEEFGRSAADVDATPAPPGGATPTSGRRAWAGRMAGDDDGVLSPRGGSRTRRRRDRAGAQRKRVGQYADDTTTDEEDMEYASSGAEEGEGLIEAIGSVRRSLRDVIPGLRSRPGGSNGGAATIKERLHEARVGSVQIGGDGKLGRSPSSSPPRAKSSGKSGAPPGSAGGTTGSGSSADAASVTTLIKYIASGKVSLINLGVSSLQDVDIASREVREAVREAGGVELLVRLLDSSDQTHRIGALRVLCRIIPLASIQRDISFGTGIRSFITLMGGTTNEEVKTRVCEFLAHAARNPTTRRLIRRLDGLPLLINALRIRGRRDRHQGVSMAGVMNANMGSVGNTFELQRHAAMVLWSCCASERNRQIMVELGSIQKLSQLAEVNSVKLLIPVMGVLSRLASTAENRETIFKMGIMKHTVASLRASGLLKLRCAHMVACMVHYRPACEAIRRLGGLTPLVAMLDSDDRDHIVAATAAIWRCADDPESIPILQSLSLIEKLVALLVSPDDEILVCVTGTILSCCKHSAQARDVVRSLGGIPRLVNMLMGSNHNLVINACGALGACVNDPGSLAQINDLDGVRLLWSLLKSTDPQVQAAAAWAIAPCIQNAADAGALVRSFIGGLELIVKLLKSPSYEVLAAVCGAIATIARDEENLAVITDHGVVYLLSKLSSTTDDHLRRYLSEAVAQCSMWGNNCKTFGEAGCVAPLVRYLKSPEEAVHGATARALFALSNEADNCLVMHEHGAVHLLLGMIGSHDEALQEAAAGTVGNIRRSLAAVQ